MDNRKSFYYPWTQLGKREIARKRHDHLSPSALTRVILFANSSLIITPLIITIRVSNKNEGDEFYFVVT